MNKRILIVNGNPDPSASRLCAALSEAYAKGAKDAQHQVRRIAVGDLDFPIIRSALEFEGPVTSQSIRDAQMDFTWADHIVFIYPLWLGSQPAMFKGFLEQVLRYGFALSAPNSGSMKGLLAGRTAHIVVTMGMPKIFYWGVFGAFATRAFERSVLRLCGIEPIRHTHIGGIADPSVTSKAIALMTRYGARA